MSPDNGQIDQCGSLLRAAATDAGSQLLPDPGSTNAWSPTHCLTRVGQHNEGTAAHRHPFHQLPTAALHLDCNFNGTLLVHRTGTLPDTTGQSHRLWD